MKLRHLDRSITRRISIIASLILFGLLLQPIASAAETSGLQPAYQQEIDQRFGEETVLEVVRENMTSPPRVIVEQVLARLQQHIGDVIRRDDLTMVVARA